MKKLLLLFITVVALASATMTTGTISDPVNGFGAGVGGGAATFGIQNVEFDKVEPNIFTVVINTNYGTVLNTSGALPCFDFSGQSFCSPDFLIEQNGHMYGVATHNHDGLVAGDLYQGNSFQYAPGWSPARPVYINASGPAIGTGTVTAHPNVGADGVTTALYQIDLSFTTDPNFLGNDLFQIYASSADCANGFVQGVGRFETESTSPVPEPPSYLQLLIGLGTLGVCFAVRGWISPV